MNRRKEAPAPNQSLTARFAAWVRPLLESARLVERKPAPIPVQAQRPEFVIRRLSR